MIHSLIPVDLASRLLLVIEGLRHAVGSYPYRGPAAFDLVVRVRAELRRRFERFERMLARFRAGEAPRPAPTGSDRGRDASRPERPGALPKRDRSRETPRLPRGKAWLVAMMPYVVALYAIRLRMYVDDPVTAAFLGQCPEARRILRPIWWMVCADPLPNALREPPGAAEPADAPEHARPDHTPSLVAGEVAVAAGIAALALTHEAVPSAAPAGVPVLYQFWDPQPLAPPTGSADASSAPPRRNFDV